MFAKFEVLTAVSQMFRRNCCLCPQWWSSPTSTIRPHPTKLYPQNFSTV